MAEGRQRRLFAAVVLALSAIVAAYLLFFTPKESDIPTPTSATPVSLAYLSVQLAHTSWIGNVGAVAPSDTEADPSLSDQDDEEDQDVSRPMLEMPEWMRQIAPNPENSPCPEAAVRTVEVTNVEELTGALEGALPGDRILLSSGTYEGNFVLSASGRARERIWICGPRDAVFDSGGPKNEYGLHITGDYAGVWGLKVTNAHKGIMIDGGNIVQVDNVDVYIPSATKPSTSATAPRTEWFRIR